MISQNITQANFDTTNSFIQCASFLSPTSFWYLRLQFSFKRLSGSWPWTLQSARLWPIRSLNPGSRATKIRWPLPWCDMPVTSLSNQASTRMPSTKEAGYQPKWMACKEVLFIYEMQKFTENLGKFIWIKAGTEEWPCISMLPFVVNWAFHQKDGYESFPGLIWMAFFKEFNADSKKSYDK